MFFDFHVFQSCVRVIQKEKSTLPYGRFCFFFLNDHRIEKNKKFLLKYLRQIKFEFH